MTVVEMDAACRAWRRGFMIGRDVVEVTTPGGIRVFERVPEGFRERLYSTATHIRRLCALGNLHVYKHEAMLRAYCRDAWIGWERLDARKL